MIPEVTAQSVLGVVGKDTVSLSTPLKILCSDGKVYLLKPDVYIQQGSMIPLDSIMLNEAFGSFILSTLSLSTPSFAKLTLDNSFFVFNSAAFESNVALMYRADFPYFVTEYIEGDDGNLHRTFKKYIFEGKLDRVKSILSRKIATVKNKHELALSILGDIFMLNTDRFSNVGNLVFSHDNSVHWIDHGSALFSPRWGDKSSSFMEPDVDTLANRYYDSLLYRNRDPFLLKILDEYANWEDDKIVELIEQLVNINEFSLRSFLNSLPIEWYVNDTEQKRAIISLFRHQIELTLAILRKLIDANFLNNLQEQGGIDSCTLQEDTGTQ